MESSRKVEWIGRVGKGEGGLVGGTCVLTIYMLNASLCISVCPGDGAASSVWILTSCTS